MSSNKKYKFVALDANGTRGYFNNSLLLQAQQAAHKEAAILKTIVISVTEVTQ